MMIRTIMMVHVLILSVTTILTVQLDVASKTGERGVVLPNEVFVGDNGSAAHFHQRQLESSADFRKLSCNTDDWNCVPWPHGINGGTIEIPCNTCYSMDAFSSGEKITLTGPLDIKGKLDFPDGTKVTLETTGIFVQGELSMSSTKTVNGIPDIIIKLTGSDDILFTPDPENFAACEETSCNLGPKPIVVAGGKLTINGMPDSCPTWTTVADHERGAKPNPTEYRKQPTPPPQSVGICESALLEESFESGNGKWYGNLGAEEKVLVGSHDGSQYLHVTSRTETFQGPIFDFNRHLRNCTIPDIDYLFQAKIRISASDGVSTSLCSALGENCPGLNVGFLDSEDQLKWRKLAAFHGTTFVDGDWHDVKASFRFDPDYVANGNIFTVLLLHGPEAGIDISLDDISIILPPAAAYPDPNDVCGDLIQNGSADLLNGFPAPMYSFIKSNTILIEYDGSGNEYFHITDRNAGHDSLALDLTPQCLADGVTYTFSMNIKIDSPVEAVPIVVIKTHTGVDDKIFDIVTTCPPSSTSTGWIMCTNDFTFKTYHSTSSKVELLTYLKNDMNSDIFYDDMSFIYKSGSVGAMILTEDVVSCWDTGADVVFSSNTLLYESTKVTSLESVLTNNRITTVETFTPLPTTAAENPHTASEIALLSRNILFLNADDSSSGPSLLVLRTPNITQIIQGVEFNGFGIQGVAGKHPINFKLSGNSTGSIVSKNSIRNSNSRCVNIHSTRNILVNENVAHHTYGHCYALEGEGETGNVFRKNFGVVTLKPAIVVPGSSDDDPATFYISYPTNSWVGNSAAGGEAYGFWFELNKQTDGWLKPWVAPLTAFEDNKSHSNKLIGLKTSPFGYNPSITATLLNCMIYKNRGQGIFTHNTGNIIIKGGYFSDNKIGIDILQDNAIGIQNITIVGFSPEYKSLVSRHKSTTPTFCFDGGGFIGIRLHIREKVPSAGIATLSDILFSDFDIECNSEVYAIAMHSDTARGSNFNTVVSMTQLSFNGFTSISNKINFCDADEAGIVDINLNDIDGSLNPSDSSPGFVVSNRQNMLGDSCTLIDGSCAQFCANKLAEESDVGVLSVEYKSSSSSESSSSTASSSIDDYCIANADFEHGVLGWRAQHSDGGLVVVTGFDGSGKAMKVLDRTMSATGSVWQDFSPSCLALNSWYEITADVKMIVKETENIFDCNPTILWHNDPMSCAGISLFRMSATPPLKEIAFTVGPYASSGWARIYGTFQATQDIMSQSSVGLLVGRAAIASDIIVDNIVLKPVTDSSVGVTDCSQPLQNGDAELGDHRLWWVFGQGDIGSRIEISNGGYGGSNHAFRHVGPRDKKNRGMLQKMDGSCFPPDSKWSITAKFKYFEENGTFVSCDKDKRNGSSSCPTFQMLPDGLFRDPPLHNTDEEVMQVGEWNDIKNEFTVPSGSNFKELHILLTSVNPGFNYEIDNIELTLS